MFKGCLQNATITYKASEKLDTLKANFLNNLRLLSGKNVDKQTCASDFHTLG